MENLDLKCSHFYQTNTRIQHIGDAAGFIAYFTNFYPTGFEILASVMHELWKDQPTPSQCPQDDARPNVKIARNIFIMHAHNTIPYAMPSVTVKTTLNE